MLTRPLLLQPLRASIPTTHALTRCNFPSSSSASALSVAVAVRTAQRRAFTTVKTRSVSILTRITCTCFTKRRETLSSPSSRPFSSSATTSNNHTAPSTATPSQDATSEKLRKVLRNVPFPVVSTSSKNDPSLRRGITVSSFTSISLQPLPLVAFCVKLPSRASTILHESDGFVVQFLASDQIAHSVAFSSSVPPPTPPVSSETSTTTTSSSSSSMPSPQEISTGSRGRAVNQGRDKDIDDLVSEASQQTLMESLRGEHNSEKKGHVAVSTSRSEENKTVAPRTESDPDPFEVLGYRTDPESQLPVLLNTLGAIRCKTHQVMVVGDHEMWIGQVEKVLHGGDGVLSEMQEPLLYHDRSYRKVGKRIY